MISYTFIRAKDILIHTSCYLYHGHSQVTFKYKWENILWVFTIYDKFRYHGNLRDV